MKRLTKKDDRGYYLTGDGIYSDWGVPEKFRGDDVDRLAAIEDILGDEYDLDRLRELAEADRLIGMTVYEANKRGFISTYEVISVHISKCSILVGWNLLDGVYSNLNGFEISALGKSIFLTREEAEAALKAREQDGNTE